jgi:hypothetical protein
MLYLASTQGIYFVRAKEINHKTMIKFFRKIRQKLVSENKFSKYFIYAIGEIILVVIGILIAVQINNWNIERLDKKLEVKYLNNITLDLQKDLSILETQIEYRKRRIIGDKKLIKQINGMPVDNLTELSKNVINSLMAERFTPNNNTYLELSSSGKLHLISNDSIKLLLLELEKLYKRNSFGIEHETFDYQEYISKPIFKYTNTDQLVPVFTGEKTIEEQEVTVDDFKGLFESQEYKNGLFIIGLISHEILSIYDKIEAKSKRVIEIIKKEIKK